MRSDFIREKAQAITENISSCYKEHNRPHFDNATLQKLQLRRSEVLQVCVDAANEAAAQAATEDDCNVITTATIEQTITTQNAEEENNNKHMQEFSLIIEDFWDIYARLIAKFPRHFLY